MKVLLTGATGMVGQNIQEQMAGHPHFLLTPGQEELNLLDSQQTHDYVQRFAPDIIVHAAGRVGGIQANLKDPSGFLLDNFEMGRHLLLAAKDAGVPRLINLGSSCMYPRNHETPLDESMVLKGELEPTNEGYALAKIAVARLCKYLSDAHPELSFKTLIPCNLYGRWDKFAPEHSHMIPGVMRRMHEAKRLALTELEIWGDGEARREFMYAGDLARCIVRAIENFDSLPPLMNVGLGYDYSINEYYEAIAQTVGFAGRFVHDLSKPVGMRRKLCDVQLMQEWGWKPEITLAAGLRMAYEFFLSKEISR